MLERAVTIRKLLYGGKPSYVWTGRIIEQTDSGVVVEATFSHPRRDLGYIVLEPGDRWVESYFFDRWYNIFEIYDRAGQLKGWYCNVCTPAHLSDNELSFVDLALDLFAYPDGRYLVLDEDAFARGREEEYLPEDARSGEKALEELIALAREGRLPRHH